MSAVRLSQSRVTPLALPGATTPTTSKTRVDPAHETARQPADPVYLAGPENTLVAAAVSRMMAAADKPADKAFPAGTLTLIGPPGSGKSLLAGGVRSAWAKAHGDEAVLCTTGIDLRRQLERAFAVEKEQPGIVEAIIRRLAEVRLLVLESIEGIVPSEPTVELLGSTLDRLSETGGRCLVTASKPLGEIAGLDTRTVGRLASGLTLEVAPPSVATRGELLTGAVEAAGCRIDQDAAADLAAWLPADARRVLSTAGQLSDRFGRRVLIDRHRVKAFIGEATREESTTPLADIATVVARYYSMPLRQLRSSSRKAPIVLARAITIFLARQLTPLSYDEIGRYLGGRDHTTVMHNFNRINDQMPKDRALRSAIDDLLRKLGRSDLIGGGSVAEELSS